MTTTFNANAKYTRSAHMSLWHNLLKAAYAWQCKRIQLN